VIDGGKRLKRLTAWGVALTLAAACTASPPSPRPTPLGKPAATGGQSGSSDGPLVPLPIEDIDPGSKKPTCEEMATQVDEGCQGYLGPVECIRVTSLEPSLECVDPPLGFGGGVQSAWGGEGGVAEAGSAGQGGEASQPLRFAACPAYDVGGRCFTVRCVDSARLFPDGSAECCYALQGFTCF